MQDMQITRSSFLCLAAGAAVAAALCLAGPGFAKGGGGGGGGGGSSSSSGSKSGSGSSTKTPPAKPKTVYEVIDADTSLSKFRDALKAAGLDATLKGSGPFTVLAPSDTAFGKVDAAKLTDLGKPENKAKYKSILEGHVLTSKMKAADIAKATKLSASGGASHDVKLDTDKTTALIDGVAKITKTDIEGSNGLIQIIDTVLIPADKAGDKPAPGGSSGGSGTGSGSGGK
jgi:uncharacterized surface protein with fasciclin (FAS1) repeats